MVRMRNIYQAMFGAARAIMQGAKYAINYASNWPAKMFSNTFRTYRRSAESNAQSVLNVTLIKILCSENAWAISVTYIVSLRDKKK